jgi:hypothetical protein
MDRFNRFGGKHKSHGSFLKSVGGSVLVFLAVLLVFLFAIGKMGEQTADEQKQYLQEAIERSMLQCYVTEGRYPSSFDYLQEKYGIVYDSTHFRVDYVVYGSNMRPEVTIVELEGVK